MRKTLGHRVAETRKERGWSQADLAEKVRQINPNLKTGISSISSIETNTSEKPTILDEIAVALGVTTHWLRTGEEPKRQTPVNSGDVNLLLEQVLEALKGSYEALGVPDAPELAELVLESAQEPRIAGEEPSLRERKMIIASLTKQFLLSKRIRKRDG